MLQIVLGGAKNKVCIFKSIEEIYRIVFHETNTVFGCKELDKYYEDNWLFFKMLLEFFKEIEKQKPKIDVKRVINIQKRVVDIKVDKGKLMCDLISQLKER